jgi:hypothetical protein
MKSYRHQEMKYLVILYALLFLLMCTNLELEFPLDLPGSEWYLFFSISNSVVLAGIVSLATFIMDCFISSSAKDRLLGMFLIPKSGSTVFSKIKDGKIRDDRIYLPKAIEYYDDIIKELPAKKKERRKLENSKWYAIYCRYQERGAVAQSQRDYLLCRDMFVQTVSFIAFYLISLILFGDRVQFSLKFVGTLCSFGLIINIAAHSKMKRFVYTVIALDLAEKK